MKKIILSITLMIGFLLIVSESTTFVPNIIGMLLTLFSADRLKLFEL